MTDIPEGQLYRIGDQAVSGHKIKTILGQSSEFAVYQTANGEMRWEYRGGDGTLPSEFTPAVQQFDLLLSDIKSRMPHRHKEGVYAQLGKSLFAAINAGDPAKYRESFIGVEKVIDRRCLEKARFIYVIATVVTAACIMLPLTIVAVNQSGWQEAFIVGALGGVVGAVLSVLHRNHDLSVDPRVDDKHTVMQGSSRAFLGGMFGVLVVLAIEANILTGFFAGDGRAMGLMAVAAGFSERLVPEIIRSLERYALRRVDS